jgi:hypothetical protein
MAFYDLIDDTTSLQIIAALYRHLIVKPGRVRAVVVVHVLLLDVLVRLSLCVRDVPVLAAVPPQGRRVARRRAAATVGGAGVDVEALVPRGEGRLGPVHLGLPAVRGPGGAVPDARADQHRLLRRELVRARHGARQIP